MRTRLLTFLLVLAAGMLPADSFALASANIVLSKGRSLTLDQTGFATFGPPDVYFIRLRPGESAEFTLSYSITVTDDGLPVEPLTSPFHPPPPGLGCDLSTGTFCGPPFGLSHEAAAAGLDIEVQISGFSPRNPPPPGWDWDFAGTRIRAATVADSFADSVSRSATFHLNALNTFSSNQSAAIVVWSAAWALASPIPEPTIALQLALGGALLGLGALARKGSRE